MDNKRNTHLVSHSNGGADVSGESKRRHDEDFEKKREEDSLTDRIPDEEMRKEKKEEKEGTHSKNDSMTEQKYDEDLRP